jgi:hypothetical protein
VLANDTGTNYRCDVTNAYVQISTGAVTGTGTPNQITKWDGTGAALQDSRISDDGTNVSITDSGTGFALTIDTSQLVAPATYSAYTIGSPGNNYLITGKNGSSRTGPDSPLALFNDFANVASTDNIYYSSTGGAGLIIDGAASQAYLSLSNSTGFGRALQLTSLTSGVAELRANTAGAALGRFTMVGDVSTSTDTLRANGLITSEVAATNDRIGIIGRSGGTGSYILKLTPTTLTSSHTATFPDADITVARTDAAQTFTGTQTFSSTISGSINGNSATTTALAANPTDCGSDTWATTIAASGNLTCSAVNGGAGITDGTVVLADLANMATSSLYYRKTAGSGAPEVNTLATLKTDLGLTGTNSGDQTITLTGDVAGTGTGTFATTIATGAVTSGKILDGTIAAADLGTGSVDVSSSVVTGTLAAGREPAHTGEVTNSAGSLALTIDKMITPTWTGLHTFQSTISNLSTTASQLTEGYDTSNKMTFDTAAAGTTTVTLAGGTADTTRLILKPSGSAMASSSGTAGSAVLAVQDFSGNQKWYVGRVSGAGATNHGVRIGNDSTHYLEFASGAAAATGACTMSLTGLTSLALPNPTSATSPNWTTPTLTGTVSMTTGNFSSTAAAGADGYNFGTTATRSTGNNLMKFTDNGVDAYQVLKTATGYSTQGNFDFKLTTAGNGLYVKEGTNATMGTATANGTTAVTVSTTKVTASSRIFLTCNNPNGGIPGVEYVNARTAGTSFDIKSSVGDTCIVSWIIIEPS